MHIAIPITLLCMFCTLLQWEFYVCWGLLIELPGSIPVYLLQKIVCFEVGHEGIHNCVVPSDDILFGEVSRTGGQVVQFYDASAIHPHHQP